MANARICAIPECGKPHQAKGYCQVHYDRFRTHGDPHFIKTTPKGAALSWLQANAAHTADECLPWPFPTKHGDYGGLRYKGRPSPASRVMCILAHGMPSDPKLEAAHNCNNPICVNPNHLRWATRKENAADRVGAGSDSRGERNRISILKECQVRQIKYDRRSTPAAQLAAEFGVAVQTIRCIRSGYGWSWL